MKHYLVRTAFCAASLAVIFTVSISPRCFAQVEQSGTGTADQVHDVLSKLASSIGDAGVEVYMNGTQFAHEQTRDPQDPIQNVIAKQRFLLSPDGQFLLQADQKFPGQIQFRFRLIGSKSGEVTFDELKWRGGTEMLRRPALQAQQDYADLLLFCPAFLAVDALRHNLTIDPMGTSDDTLYASYRDDLGRLISIVLDRGAGTIAGVMADKQYYRYKGWHTVHGLPQPFRVEGVDAAWNVDAYPRTHFPESDFAVPSGYIDERPQPALHLSSLGHGTYRVDGAPSEYHSGVVVGDTGIAIFDPSDSPEETTSIRHLVEQTFPGKPIRYVVLSHVHHDHIAGLPIYFSDPVSVLAGAGARISLKRQFPDWNASQLQEVVKSTTLDLGGTQIQLHPVASSHSSTMLVLYAPQSKTLFQGDLFYLPDVGETPPGFEGAEELSGLIATQHLSVETIVGVHGRSGGMEQLRDAIRLKRQGRSFSSEPPITWPSAQ